MDGALTGRSDPVLGVPCLVDTAQPDPSAAALFYGGLFGWAFDDGTAMAGGVRGDYLTARLGGQVVSGVAPASPSSTAVWRTHVRVGDIDQALIRAEDLGGVRVSGVVDVGARGRFASLQDPAGVALCLWQAGSSRGVEVTGEPGAWAMSSLHTSDLDQAREFYGTLFGWELDATPGAPFSRWRASGRVIAVATLTDGVAVPAHWSVNFAVSDADAIAERAVALGGSVVMAPMDTPGFRSAVVADPQGGFIAVSARSTDRGVEARVP